MDRFVVGTGRCGSTLLSRMLAQHEQVLSVSEFFNGLDATQRFATRLSGDTLTRLVSEPQPFVTAVLRRGYEVAEVTYPFTAAGARYRPQDPLPWILVSMLPSLTATPDVLFDETVEWTRSAPTRPAPEQYRALFGWLGERLGRPWWVERSGGAIDYAGELAREFPEARFVHIHRDGPEAALSMREHPAFRLSVALRNDAELDDGSHPSEVGAFDLQAEPTGDDGVSRVLRARLDPVVFGRFWSEQIGRGLDGLDALPPGRVHTVRFEDLVTRPAPVLDGVAAFFELPGGAWIRRAAELVSGPPAARLPGLLREQAEALVAVCREATERLGA